MSFYCCICFSFILCVLFCRYVLFLCFFLYVVCFLFVFFFFKQKTAYEMRISDWSSDVCSSDLSGSGHIVPIQPRSTRAAAKGYPKRRLYRAGEKGTASAQPPGTEFTNPRPQPQPHRWGFLFACGFEHSEIPISASIFSIWLDAGCKVCERPAVRSQRSRLSAGRWPSIRTIAGSRPIQWRNGRVFGIGREARLSPELCRRRGRCVGKCAEDTASKPTLGRMRIISAVPGHHEMNGLQLKRQLQHRQLACMTGCGHYTLHNGSDHIG